MDALRSGGLQRGSGVTEKEEKAILENARRLRDDARHLSDFDRLASCGLLQVLCLEELGKLALVKMEIPRDQKAYHRQKQVAAIALVAGYRVSNLLEEKCKREGWDYWGDIDDAEKWYEWMLTEEGRGETSKAIADVYPWLRESREGFLEKLRQIAAYMDPPQSSIGATLEPGRIYTYRAFDRWFVNTAFEFIDAAFECIADDKCMVSAAAMFRFGRFSPSP
jgi:AbiV family abortive infection protein